MKRQVTMTRGVWVFFAIGMLFSAVSWADKGEARYQTWLKTPETFIRVGLKKPVKVAELYSMATLLVLNDRKVVDSIQPGGEFRVLVDNQAGAKTRYWVQLRAEKSAENLNAERRGLQSKNPDLNFAVMRSGSYQTLRMGPFSTKDHAQRMQRRMQVNGYGDAFIVTLKAGRGFFWVNDRFDKFPLSVTNLALVSADPDSPITFEGTGYRGILRFRYQNGRLRVINELPLETYLRGVVPSELGPKVFPEVEALKAQAVAARTYALKNMNRFNSRGYDICDGPACQAYEGVKNEDEMSDLAVLETKGMVLYYQDTLIDALYTSTCGGQTDDVGNVFPGRDEPYLRGKTSYLANYSRWDLPERPTDSAALSPQQQDLQIRALIFGMEKPPNLEGTFTAEEMREAMAAFSWVLGKVPAIEAKGNLTHKAFWQIIAQLPFIADTAKQQIHEPELKKVAREYGVSKAVQPLAAFLLRFDLTAGATPKRLELDSPVSAMEAYTNLIQLTESLGPEPEWDRYRLDKLSGSQLELSRGSRTKTLDLGRIRYYVTKVEDGLVFREGGEMEAHDNLYLIDGPFPKMFLRLHQASTVASVDRFSVFDSWMEKKSVQDLEKRARRYISQLRGLRDIKILSRSDTGRVTLLEFIADSGRFKVDGLRIRWSLGIRENLFNMSLAYKDGRLVHGTFFGRGWGHGVGMSQVGAYGLAQMGWTYDQILKHYYDGVSLLPYRDMAPSERPN